MSKITPGLMNDVFEIPTEPKEKKLNSKNNQRVILPQKADPEFEKDVSNYLDEVKRTVSAQKAPRKNNITEEGRKQMLANLKKGRETRKMNLNKAHEVRQNELKADIDEMKTLLKSTLGSEPKVLKIEAEPKVLKVEAPKVEAEPKVLKVEAETKVLKVDAEPKVLNVEQPKPIVIAPPVKQLIIKSTYKKPLW
jgi:hypothetical protein